MNDGLAILINNLSCSRRNQARVSIPYCFAEGEGDSLAILNTRFSIGDTSRFEHSVSAYFWKTWAVL